MGAMDNFLDKAKAKAKEWDIEGKAEKVASEVGKAATEAKEKAAVYADENRDKVSGALDKAGAKIDERTEGKYADRIAKAKKQVSKGVDKLAEQRPAGTPGAAGMPGAADPGVPASPSAPAPTTAQADEPAGAWRPTEDWSPNEPWSPDSGPQDAPRRDPQAPA